MLMSAAPATAQFEPRRDPRPATSAEVIGGNVLLGGVIAAGRALFTGTDPLRAFAIGAIGGGVYLAGKNLAVEPGAANAWAGLVLASTGTAVVANAGRGVHPLREVSLPLASARLHITPFDERKVRLAINLLETAVIVQHSVTDAVVIDWNRSLASGAVVFFAKERRIFLNDEEYGGFAVAPTVLISTFVPDTARMIRHEVVHVYQQWFLQESLGRPIEDAIRKRLKLARYVPKWLEIGVVAPGLLAFENWASRGNGMRRILEAEAQRLELR